MEQVTIEQTTTYLGLLKQQPNYVKFGFHTL